MMMKRKMQMCIGAIFLLSVALCTTADAQNLPNGVKKSATLGNLPSGIICCEKNVGLRTYCGYYTADGKELLPCIYDLTWSDKAGAYLKKDGKFGYFSFSAKRLLAPDYCLAIDFTDYKNYSFIVKDAVINDDGMLFPHNGRYKVSGGVWGACDKDGNIVIPCKFDFCQPINRDVRFWQVSEGATVGNGRVAGGKWGIYSNRGEMLVPVVYDACYVLCDGFYCVNNGGSVNSGDYFSSMIPGEGKWGVVTNGGAMVVPIEFDEVRDGETTYKGKRFFWTRKGDKWGVYSDGKEVMPASYADNNYLYEDVFAVKIGDKWALYGEGRELTAPVFEKISGFTNGVAMMKQDGEQKLVKNPLRDASSIVIAAAESGNKRKADGPAVSRYPAPNSDVDKNIPSAKTNDENTFVFIISNENYDDAPVPYSLNDGRMVAEYCKKTLGIPEKHVNLYEDATLGNIVMAMDRIKNIAESYDGEARMIVYYSGHGYPDQASQEAYILPVDGNASDIAKTGYSLKKLYTELGRLKLKSVIVFIDACFSGAQRTDAMLSQSRGVAIKPKSEAVEGNIVVLSASQGDETAHQLEEKGHGLFTYYLLKQLQATGGEVTFGELADYVTKMVKRQSVVINNKKQTPSVNADMNLGDSWRDIKLRN